MKSGKVQTILILMPFQIYELWNTIRENKLKEELERVDRYNRIHKIGSLMEEMKEREQRLWFFENEDQIDVELETRGQHEDKKKKITARKQKLIDDDNYVPPEVASKRN